jgi:Holliday junction resolvase
MDQDADRDQVEASLHFLMISVLVEALEKEGFTVAADHIGGTRPRPAAIGDFTPDIEARKGEVVHLIEVETQGTLETSGALEQLRALVGEVNAKSYVAVPFDCIERARKLRELLEGDLGILPCYPFVRYVGTVK